jgi:hypothetical protein
MPIRFAHAVPTDRRAGFGWFGAGARRELPDRVVSWSLTARIRAVAQASRVTRRPSESARRLGSIGYMKVNVSDAGTQGALRNRMTPKTSRNPRSYDDIVRQTVVDPDSSVRPTRAQEQDARDGYRALDPDERRLQERVLHALATSGADVSGVTVEVARDVVTLSGRVAAADVLRTLEDTVARIPGVETVHDRVVVQ